MWLTPRYQSPISHIIAIFPYALRSLFASGLELPQMRALSIAVAIALRRHVRSCSPRVLHHTHPVDLACFVQVSMSAIQRGAVVVWHEVLPLENSVVQKFPRGAAPRTP